MKQKFFIFHFSFFIGLCLLAMTASAADVQVRIMTTDNRQIDGTARWQAVQRQYLVDTKVGDNTVQVTLRPQEIRTLRARPPQGWDATTRMFNPALTAAQMEAIVKDYIMLEYDVPAAAHLMRMFQRDRRFEDIIRIGDLVKAGKPETESTFETAPYIWEAMITLKRTGRLNELLDRAQSSPFREVAAMAAVRRGDFLMAEGRTREALKDGYLRVVTLFRDVKAVQPEALYKSALAFDELQQVHYATKMRQTLLSNFGTSEWAGKVGGQ